MREVKLSGLVGVLMAVGLLAAVHRPVWGNVWAAGPVLIAQGTAAADGGSSGTKDKTMSRDQTTGAPDAKESGTVAAGKAIFEQRCAICHYSESTAKKIGFGLKGLYSRRTFATGKKKVDDVSVTNWIENGGADMPGFRAALKPEQVRSLVAYLRTL